jgi:hypothetical protein
VLCPVRDPEIRRYLRFALLPAYLRDDTRATVLRSDGRYERIHETRTGNVDAQQLLMSNRPPIA